jgi:hypothetical protein
MSSFPNMEYEEDASPLPPSTKQDADLLDGMLSPCASDDDAHTSSRVVNASDPQTVWVRAAPQLPSIQFDDEESDHFISPYNQERAHLEFNAEAIDRPKVSVDQSKINRSDDSPPESEVQPPLDTPPTSHRRRPRAIKKISSPHSPPTPPLAPRSPRRKARLDRFARQMHTEPDLAGASSVPELDSFHRPVIATATPRRSHYLRASLLTSTGENKTDKLQLALVPTADHGQQPIGAPLSERERGRRTKMIPLRSRVGVPLSIVVPATGEPTVRSRSCPRKNRPQSSPTVRLSPSSFQTRARAKASQSYSPESPSRRSKISSSEQQDTKIGGPAV